MKKITLKTTLALLATAGLSQAAITYVDANAGNTTLANGDAYSPTATTVNDDNLWSLRTVDGSNNPFGNSSTVYTANDNNANPGEDAPELRTTISGLVAGGTYTLYTYFWGSATTGNGQWDIQAGTTSGSLTTYNYANATSLGDGYVNDGLVYNSTDFTSSVLVESGNRDLIQASLGTFVADGSGNINIYINDNPGNDDRTWYDGVGYELVAVPEPSTSALFGLAGLGLLLRRRR